MFRRSIERIVRKYEKLKRDPDAFFNDSKGAVSASLLKHVHTFLKPDDISEKDIPLAVRYVLPNAVTKKYIKFKTNPAGFFDDTDSKIVKSLLKDLYFEIIHQDGRKEP